MLRRKDTFTVITPIPGFIPRQLAIDILHSHSEVITLNPLVIDHKPIPAPQNAETDEFYSTWYEITERIQVVPGIGKMGSSTIRFNGCFHDMPWGLQTHIYAPAGIDLRNKYRIAGNQPGVETPEVPEIGLKGLGAPSDGLYLREDIEIKGNVTVLSFAKSQLKKAGGEMVKRIIKKAELLDAGVLQAMIEDGKLKTINPADRSGGIKSPTLSPVSPRFPQSVNSTPPPGSPPIPYQVPRIQSSYGQYQRPGTASSQGHGPYQPPPQMVQELPATGPSASTHAPIEMPGDFYHATPNLQPDQRSSYQQFGTQPHPHGGHHDPSSVDPIQRSHNMSPNPSVGGGQWSTGGSRPTSVSSGLPSPGLGVSNNGNGNNSLYPAALAPHKETKEEHHPQQQQPPQYMPYNPADYGKVAPGQQPQQHGQGHPGQGYNYAQ
ncbi:uncharacterized protein C8A04DRAFT_35251 [Dichotomopilus funicola]|uniref:DUF7053 domain-containing protein n=1 Tax=Dichotomopilus funicola TaxID=1934379 RepID=A0AAN6V8H9_9PEZI|nr:hypothetical protein C8A04DRAFT_35251 [Dichotomopilus funicola]